MRLPAPIRWSGDEDHYFGPFTFHMNHTTEVGMYLKFGDKNTIRSYARLHLFRWTLLFPIPTLIRPWRRWIDLTHLKDGPGGYYETGGHTFGFSVQKNEMFWHIGRSDTELLPNGSSRSSRGVWFYPWSDQTMISKHSILPDGSEMNLDHHPPYVVTFTVQDFDGQMVQAEIRLSRTRYRIGRGVWHWLLLGRRKDYHTAQIQFSSEVGREKGSWKGGIIGVVTNVNPDESHIEALKRYCGENGMTFIGLREMI